jgi:hypothetical protein
VAEAAQRGRSDGGGAEGAPAGERVWVGQGAEGGAFLWVRDGLGFIGYGFTGADD